MSNINVSLQVSEDAPEISTLAYLPGMASVRMTVGGQHIDIYGDAHRVHDLLTAAALEVERVMAPVTALTPEEAAEYHRYSESANKVGEAALKRLLSDAAAAPDTVPPAFRSEFDRLMKQ